MDDQYVEQLVLLERILHDGVKKLLSEARSKNYLEPPYGRKPNPTPLITEEQFLGMGGLDCDDEDPEFIFEYGFDPLKFLSDYILWAHPDSVEARRQEKLDAVEYLVKRARHSKLQLNVASVLQSLFQQQSSGILWGPFMSPVDGTSIMCVCKPLRMGVVTFQISNSETFIEIIDSVDVEVQSILSAVEDLPGSAKISEGFDSAKEQTVQSAPHPLMSLIAPVKALFRNLKAATKYYVRCCLKDTETLAAEHKAAIDATLQSSSEEESGMGADFHVESDGFNGVYGGKFTTSSLWTFPSDDPVSNTSESEANSKMTSNAPSANQSVVSSRRQSRRETRAVHNTPPPAPTPPPSYQPIALHCFGQVPIRKLHTYVSHGGYGGRLEETLSTDAKSKMQNDDIGTFPEVTCLLGDLLEHRGSHSNSIVAHTSGNINTSATVEAAWHTLNGTVDYMDQLSSIFCRCSLFSNPRSPLRNSSLLLAWRDGSVGSSIGVREEELAHKQFRHDYRRWNKKYGSTAKSGRDKASNLALSPNHAPPIPAMKRPPYRDSVRSVLLDLPISLERMPCMISEVEYAVQTAAATAKAPMPKVNPTEIVKACRMMYRSMMMGPDVQLIVLDMRGGEGRGGDYLGKEQAAWLQGKLKESLAQWKIIMCGRSIGMIGIKPPASSSQEHSIESTNNTRNHDQQRKFNIDEAAVPDELVGKPPSLGVIKQVQLQEPDKAHIAAAEEDVDELYGRSLCSLQHVLAMHEQNVHEVRGAYEKKLEEANPSPPIDPSQSAIRISSGVIVLSSGMTRVSTSLTERSLADTSNKEVNEDVLAPAFICAYSSLNGPPLGSEDPDVDIAAQRLPLTDQIPPNAFKDMYCAEVCLGQLDMRENLDVTKFCFRDGVVADTIYSAANGYEDGDGKDLQSCESYCRVSVTNRDFLSIELHRAEHAITGATWTVQPLKKCLFSAPIPPPPSEAED